jgi:MFS family permease
MSSTDHAETAPSTNATLGSRIVPGAVLPIEKPDRYAYRALIASLAGNILDTFDNLLLGFLLVAISTEFNLSRPEAGSIATATLIGAVAGGILFGILSDYLGRVRVLAWTILIFAACTGLCALSVGYWDLLTYRTLAGLGIGGEWGIGMALVAEAWPAGNRARGLSFVGIGGPLGVLLAAFVTPLLLPLIGWRGTFVVGALPAILAFVLRRFLDEPQIYQRQTKRSRSAFSVWLLFKDAQSVKSSIGMIILCAAQSFGFFGLLIWLPTYLSTQFGYGVTQSAAWTAVTALGMIIGILLFGELADRIGRRPAFFVYQAGAFLMVLIYSQLTSQYALLIGGGIMGIFVNGMIAGLGTLMSELYPTEARGTAESGIFNVGRGFGGFGPLIVGILASRYSFAAAIAWLSSIYVIEMIATAALIPERRGMALE